MQIRERNDVRQEKVVLLGPSSSGKTSLVNRIISDKFSSSMRATVGAAFMTKTFEIGGAKMKLDIWDTGGSEKYKSLAPMYYRDARGVIVVFDLTNSESMVDAQSWIDEVRQNGNETLIIVGAANKSDLETKRQITRTQVEEFSFKNQLDCTKETSALTGEGVVPIFDELCKLLAKLPPIPRADDDILVGLDVPSAQAQQPQTSGCSC